MRIDFRTMLAPAKCTRGRGMTGWQQLENLPSCDPFWGNSWAALAWLSRPWPDATLTSATSMDANHIKEARDTPWRGGGRPERCCCGGGRGEEASGALCRSNKRPSSFSLTGKGSGGRPSLCSRRLAPGRSTKTLGTHHPTRCSWLALQKYHSFPVTC